MAAAKKDTKNTSVAKPALTAMVLCDQDHKLSGLFVVFKLKAPAGDSKSEKLARILEGTPDPGQPPVEPKPIGNGKKDKEAAAKFKQAAAKYKDAKARYDEKVAAHDDTPPDPSDQFVLGIVDDDGFLQPVHDDFNPWYDVATKRDPDSYKISVGETYEVSFVRHPNPDVARALVRHLNGESVDDDAKYGVVGWADKLTHDVKVEKVTTGGADQAVMRASEKAEDHVPPGSDDYGGWILYRDMPHAQCGGLASGLTAQVKALAKRMGILCFPIGDMGSPYTPKKTSIVDRRLGAKGNGKKPPTVDVVEFDGQVQAAVARLQEHASKGEAWKLNYKDKAQGGDARAALLGKATDYTWDVPAGSWTLGVVDDTTADLISDWIDNGLRKPDEIVVPTAKSWVWLLARGAVSLDLWSELVKACGFSKGVVPGSSMRSVMVGAWPGAIMNSVHKTGLAVDMAGGGNRFTSPDWPVRYEAHWVHHGLDKAKYTMQRADERVKLQAEFETVTDPKAKQSIGRELARMKDVPSQADAKANWEKVKAEADKDGADGKWTWTQRWRLYGQSQYDLFSHSKRADEVAKLKQSLATYRDGVKDILKKLYFPSLEGDDVSAWIDERSADAIAFATELIAMDDEALIERYFRHSVVQFHVNAYEGDGGSAGKVCWPQGGDDDFPRAPGKSWVNISALGYPLGMERIGPHTTAVRDQAWVLGPDNPKAAPAPWPMATFFVVPADEDKDLVLMLHDITRNKDDALQLKEGDRDIPIVRGTGEEAKTIATYKPAHIDGDFVKAWRDKAGKWPPGFLPGPKRDGETDPRGAQFKVVFGITDDAKGNVQQVTHALQGDDFEGKSFFVVYAGKLTKVEKGAILKGKALGDKITEALKEFVKQATANKPDAPPPAAAKAKSDAKPTKKKSELPKKAAPAPPTPLPKEWTLIVQPVFARTPDAANMTFMPEDSVVLPPGSNANHLEWWHYQHRTAGPTWGDLLSECGYSIDVMRTPRVGFPGADEGPVHRGLGYQYEEISGKKSHVGSFNEGEVENRDQFTPPGG
jgi:hypothetical protein